ncbi:MAG: FHA domain-containing protein [Acidobacteria bacterium]|nr:FHA domain-containing protein [Acidobacteriota bacterium]
MIEVVLTFPTPEGTREIAIDADRTTFGRGSDVDHRIDDQGLSRLNSTIYRDGDRVWIVDENSTNGTYINGQLCVSAGTPLRSGDVIKIGNNTSLTVRLGEKQAVATAVAVSHTAPTVTSLPEQKASILPLALIAGAVMVISISAVFIGLTFSEAVLRSPRITRIRATILRMTTDACLRDRQLKNRAVRPTYLRRMTTQALQIRRPVRTPGPNRLFRTARNIRKCLTARKDSISRSRRCGSPK